MSEPVTPDVEIKALGEHLFVRQARREPDGNFSKDELAPYHEVMAIGDKVTDIKVGDLIVHTASYPNIVKRGIPNKLGGSRDWTVIRRYDVVALVTNGLSA